MSTAQLVLPIHRLTGRSVRFIEDCQGPEAASAVTRMFPGNIGVLENTRFHLAEEKNDPCSRRGWRRSAMITSTTLSRSRTGPTPRPRGYHSSELRRPGNGG